MDKIFLRNFTLLVVFLILCTSVFAWILIGGEKSLNRTDDLVVHTYQVITTAEQLSTTVEGLLAAQRGYLISSGPEFLREYEDKKAQLTELLAKLSELSVDNVSQMSRIDEIRHHILVFTERLEARSRQLNAGGLHRGTLSSAEDIAAVNDARSNIRRINDVILKAEYDLLAKRVDLMETRKHQYFNSLLAGSIVGVILLMIFNGFLFQAQSRRTSTESLLKKSEQRFALAVEGSNDGIFDWDLQTDEVFYSKQYFSMLGYHERGAFVGIKDDMMMLIHPEDVEMVRSYLNRYLLREISEYSNTYRMRHTSGYWVWVNSRAKAVFDADGKPLRLVGSNTDITYMKESQERLQQEKETAENANRAKSDFLAHMSHEIRTPLTAISGIAEILSAGITDFKPKQQKLVSTLWTSTSSLKDLISDILDFSKIESGELELAENNFPLEGLFEQVVSIMMVKAQEKGLKFIFDYASLKNVTFLGDDARLRQILINLIGNALKFSDQGEVKVRAFKEDYNHMPTLQIEVTDTGIGIAPDKFELIFERFKQADSSVSRKYGGTGLGLPISKNLALMMGGDIYLTSQLGQGSTFTLMLPFRGTVQRAPQPSPQDNSAELLSDEIRNAVTQGSRALLVEDYEGNIVVIGYILNDLGLKFDVARTGLEALNLWKVNRYDVILMDVQMPEMDGLTASTTIRVIEAEKNLFRTPIIGMTAHALIADKDKCIAAGMDAYLSKPIVENDLKHQILKFLTSKIAA